MSKYDKKIKDEEKGSEISPEPTEVDDAICDIVKRFEETEEEHQKEQEEKKEKRRKMYSRHRICEDLRNIRN